ncbi:MAG: purine-nucleoside phosphorylase, partial [Pseudomonadota bacterium]
MDQEKTYMQKISEAADAIASRGGEKPVLGAVLGSGLGASIFPFADNIRKIPYADIPHVPRPSVQGHSGTLVLLEAAGVPCAILSGRVHLYEGWDAHMVTFAVRV